LLRDGELLSWLALPDMSEEQWAPTLVRFSHEDGVIVKLLDSPEGWPTELGDRGELVVHGLSVEGGYPFTILDARVSRLDMGDRARGLRSTTLALGAHFDHETTWSSAVYGTAHLHEWLGDSGLRTIDWDRDEDGQTRRFAHEWTAPDSYVIERPDARLTLGPEMDTSVPAHSAEHHVVTDSRLGVRPVEPLTIAQFERRYARPLLAFCVLAADRPDAITYESVSDRDRGERAVVLRAGRTVQRREWRLDDRFLFRAEQIDDVAAIYRRWIDLWDEASPEIATFVDTLSEGNAFSRARLLAGVVALEAYWRTRLKGVLYGGKPRSTRLPDKLKQLRAHAGIDPTLIGVSNDNLKLLVGARNLYAHLAQTNVSLSEEEIDDRLVENSRRAAALMQACLLRDLGIEPPAIDKMFEEHLASWSLA
jgi:hypothetical protein